MSKFILGIVWGMIIGGALFSSQLSASHWIDPSVKKEQSKFSNTGRVDFSIICIEGYKYLVVAKPSFRGGVGVTQMFKSRNVGVYVASIPQRCKREH